MAAEILCTYMKKVYNLYIGMWICQPDDILEITVCTGVITDPAELGVRGVWDEQISISEIVEGSCRNPLFLFKWITISPRMPFSISPCSQGQVDRCLPRRIHLVKCKWIGAHICVIVSCVSDLERKSVSKNSVETTH
jgi:hypothetical protein